MGFACPLETIFYQKNPHYGGQNHLMFIIDGKNIYEDTEIQGINETVLSQSSTVPSFLFSNVATNIQYFPEINL